MHGARTRPFDTPRVSRQVESAMKAVLLHLDIQRPWNGADAGCCAPTFVEVSMD
jgi:hypothetical protein